MTQAVKRACDACHRRKVKCDGINPCRNCQQAQLSCTYNAVPQKKGPKGSRAKVISELRETQRQTSLAAKVQSRSQGIPCPPSTALTPTPGLLTSDLVKVCVSYFFDNMYGQLPILDRQSIEQQILYMEQNRDAYCLMASLCAFIMLQPGMTIPGGDLYNIDMLPGSNMVASQLLVEEALHVRKGYNYLSPITHNALATNYFLFACHHILEMHDQAWYYLREATTMVYMAGMNEENHYLELAPVEGSRQRRLFWLLLATERACAIRRGRPLTLQPTIELPTVSEDPNDKLALQLDGFVILADLFKSYDDAFVNTWKKAQANLATQHISRLQKQLDELVPSYLCQDSTFADPHANQQWLKNTVWQLTNRAADDSMSLQYTARVSRDLLVSMAGQFPGQGMELLNSGLIEKLLETTLSTIEFLSMQPATRQPFTVGLRERADQLINIVAMSRNGNHSFLPLLMSKVNEALPLLVNPLLQDAPEDPNPMQNHNMATMDIFDGFGTAGMAQPPPQMQHMAMDTTDYDRKFPVEEYDKQYGMDMNGSTPESHTTSHTSPSGQAHAQSQSDMSNSFSSPGIMSPGVDYSTNMNGFCAPMPDMVMSPMGHPGQSDPMSHQPVQHQTSPQHMNPHQMAPQQIPPQQMPPQQLSHSHEGMGQHQINGMRNQGMHTAGIPTSHPMNNMWGSIRPSPQRQSNFHPQAQPQMRTVGDFQALQQQSPSNGRTSMVGMGSMNTNEVDFSTL
ncbi:sucrose utilization protein-like protein [Hapsidospora chrysogenum ATCC 11550]|uniref:Sucrose utilization protein-like protein n=1 Tax=Hapsidospora chrysogenum (strain ATCC 11550 / CBS 779.69 / DSM 880 / IAM 14645 / JCM 23072 / IMI 49137) TaxID=857340 RepID=A0A086SZC7_HAPC1|nr:sucrose utilization protein-like protein [Hapsidospora chrysogenum ATCC 11550]